MNIESIQGSGSWEEFVRLVNAAKVRNAGFKYPISRRNIGSTTKANQNMISVNAVSHQKCKMYSVDAPITHKPILGTRFNAYA